MKTRLVTDTSLPGGFIIEAETPEECLILRMFTNDKRPIYIANYGGSISRNEYSMMVCHVQDATA